MIGNMLNDLAKAIRRWTEKKTHGNCHVTVWWFVFVCFLCVLFFVFVFVFCFWCCCCFGFFVLRFWFADERDST